MGLASLLIIWLSSYNNKKMKKKIEIKIIPDDEQRYDTVGDYIKKKDGWSINVSDMPGWKYEALVTIHELVEMFLCDDRKITMAEIDDFDLKYNKNRQRGDISEPGDDPRAPYHQEHQFATKIERMLAEKLGVDWETYNRKVGDLTQN